MKLLKIINDDGDAEYINPRYIFKISTDWFKSGYDKDGDKIYKYSIGIDLTLEDKYVENIEFDTAEERDDELERILKDIGNAN